MESEQNRVFKYNSVKGTAVTNNPNAFPHFIAERTTSHTQIETKDFVNMFKELIEGK